MKNNKMQVQNEEERMRQDRLRRREQMKREKMLQERRRRLLRQYLPLVVSIAGVVLLLIIGVSVVIGRAGKASEEIAKQETDKALRIEESTNPVREEKDVLPLEEEQPQPVSPKVDNTVYQFISGDGTASIYSEEVISSHAILVNAKTDTVVAAKGAGERISPASMTKVLTTLVAAENITEQQLDDVFVMTKEITDYAYVNDCSTVGFLDGEKVKVRDLFYGTTMASGGDAAVGLAVYIAGSQENFMELMNRKLEQLGLSESTHFTNCVGLYDENHYSTVYDMAVIMRAAMENELCREFLSAKKYTTAPTSEHPEGIEISNWFLRRIEDKDCGGEVLCAKTGYVLQSKNCAVSYGTFMDGVPYICVTAGSTSNWRCIYDHVEIYNRYVS